MVTKRKVIEENKLLRADLEYEKALSVHRLEEIGHLADEVDVLKAQNKSMFDALNEINDEINRYKSVICDMLRVKMK